MQQKAWLINPLADFNGSAGDEDERISEGIVVSGNSDSIEDAYLLHAATTGTIAYSEISTLVEQASSRSMAVGDMACHMLEGLHSLNLALYITKSQLPLARSPQTIKGLEEKLKRQEATLAEFTVQYPSVENFEGRRAWRLFLRQAFKNNPQRLQRIEKLQKPLSEFLNHDHSREMANDEQRKNDEGNKRTAKAELDKENLRKRKAIFKAKQKSRDELSSGETLEMWESTRSSHWNLRQRMDHRSRFPRKVEEQQEQPLEYEAKYGPQEQNRKRFESRVRIRKIVWKWKPKRDVAVRRSIISRVGVLGDLGIKRSHP